MAFAASAVASVRSILALIDGDANAAVEITTCAPAPIDDGAPSAAVADVAVSSCGSLPAALTGLLAPSSSGGDLAATSNQVNLWDNGNNEWYLTGCQCLIALKKPLLDKCPFCNQPISCKEVASLDQ